MEQCIKSLLEQTLRDIEIICIDDGSTDSSSEIIEEKALADERIRIIHQSNSGLSKTRNEGLKVAKGKYVYFIDSDDFLDKDGLEQLYHIAESEALDALLFNGRIIYEEGVDKEHCGFSENHYIKKKDYSEPRLGLDFLVDVSNEYTVNMGLIFFRRAFLYENALMFYEGILHEDNLFMFQAICASERISHTPIIIFNYRVRPGSIMQKKASYKNCQGYYICYREILLQAMKMELNENQIKSIDRILSRMKASLMDTYSSLPLDERKKVLSLDNAFERKLGESLLLKMQEENINEEKNKTQEELIRVESSISYRLGMAITFPARKFRKKIKRFISCIRKITRNLNFFLEDTNCQILLNKLYVRLSIGKPLVSIIIPAYNAEDTISDAIESLVHQTMRRIEIIVVDDGSVDATCSIVSSVNDRRIHLIKQEKTGAGAARNLGMENALGKYLLFLDADDVFDRRLCEEAYVRAKYDNADVCLYGADRLNLKTNQMEHMGWQLRTWDMPQIRPFPPDQIKNGRLFQMTQGVPWSKMYSKKFVHKHNIKFQNLNNTNDMFFVRMCLALADNLSYVDKPLVLYRYNSGTNTQSLRHKNPTDVAKAFGALKEGLITKGIYDKYERSYINIAIEELLAYYDAMALTESQQALISEVKKANIVSVNNYEETYFYDINKADRFRRLFNEGKIV